MTFGKATLQSVVSWVPLRGQARITHPERSIRADQSARPATGSQLVVPPHQTVHLALAPDLRQCEPWRQAALHDASRRDDVERLTR